MEKVVAVQPAAASRGQCKPGMATTTKGAPEPVNDKEGYPMTG